MFVNQSRSGFVSAMVPLKRNCVSVPSPIMRSTTPDAIAAHSWAAATSKSACWSASLAMCIPRPRIRVLTAIQNGLVSPGQVDLVYGPLPSQKYPARPCAMIACME